MKKSCSNWCILFLILLGALLSPVTPVLANAIGLTPTDFVLDGALKEWTKQPPTLSLIPKNAGARPGTVWIAQFSKGLVIAGRVKGPLPVFAKNAGDMPNGDHVEILIELAENVPLPPIGAQSSMDGAIELHRSEDCKEGATCKTWYADQVKHRRLLPRLFVRQWQLAPSVTVEAYAKPAFEQMSEEARETYQYLAPQGLPEARFTKHLPDGYSFEALIPWEAMPPSDRLNLDHMRVLVDVFSPGGQGEYGPFSTTSGSRQYGKVGTMNVVALKLPRRWRLTPCGYPLEGKNFWGRIGSRGTEPTSRPKKLTAYFLPTAKEEITASFAFDNDWIGRFWSPGGTSPVIVATEFFSQKLAAETTICGPELAVRHGNRVDFAKSLKIEPNPKSKKVADGWLLVGGWIGEFRDPAGQCGACEDKYLNMIFIPAATGRPLSAFQTSGIECGCCGAGFCIDDIALSNDFKTILITTGDDVDGAAKKARYCFNARKHVYVPCQGDVR